MDLGRVVFINKIALKFVEEGMGDPFLLFDVLVSDGQKPVTGNRRVEPRVLSGAPDAKAQQKPANL